MRWRDVSHVEFAVLDYDDSITFYDALFGWLGSDSFSSLNWSTSRSTTSPDTSTRTATLAFSRPDRGRLAHSDQAVGVNHIALWARSRKEVDRFHREFLVRRDVPVTDEPKDYPQYWPGYYAVFFDDPINGIHWELAWVPKVPSPRQVWSFYRALRVFAKSRTDLANTVLGVTLQARRTLPPPSGQVNRRRLPTLC